MEDNINIPAAGRYIALEAPADLEDKVLKQCHCRSYLISLSLCAVVLTTLLWSDSVDDKMPPCENTLAA